MTPRPNPDDRDPLEDYLAGEPDAVRAAAPREPGEEQWTAALRHVHARLAKPAEAPRTRWRAALVASAAALTTAAAAVGVWFAFSPPRDEKPGAPKVAHAPPVEVAPPPHAAPDPLAEFPVLPIADDDDVVLERVPGTGVFPVGAHPLPDVMRLATATEVELDDPEAVWPNVTPAPGDAPMLFAPKRR